MRLATQTQHKNIEHRVTAYRMPRATCNLQPSHHTSYIVPPTAYPKNIVSGERGGQGLNTITQNPKPKTTCVSEQRQKAANSGWWKMENVKWEVGVAGGGRQEECENARRECENTRNEGKYKIADWPTAKKTKTTCVFTKKNK